MKKILIPALISCLIIGFYACNNDDENCEDGITESLENLYNCENTESNMDVTFTTEYEIIRTQGRFDSVILGNCKPIIDFTTYDIIVGKETLSSGIDSISYQYEPACNGIDGILTVTFTTNPTSIAPTLTYHALIPKLESSESITVEIETD